MKGIINKEDFISKSGKTILNIVEDFEKQVQIKVEDLDKESTAIIVIDVINGFAKKGNLYSDRIEGIVPYIMETVGKFKGYRKLFMADAHSKESVEFEVYLEHALDDTDESELVDELKVFLSDNGQMIKKNSTNAFLSKDFSVFLAEHPEVTNFVIMGDCTDICVMQFALTLKAYFNEYNKRSRIIIPLAGVETFDLEITNHCADLMNLFALYTMKSNGIEVVSSIE